MIDVVPNAGVIALGKQGENRAVRVTLPNIRSDAGSILLLHQRSDDQKPYPVPVVEADGGIIWTVSSTDTAYPGRGQAELQWLGTDGAVIKSVTYQTNIVRALTSPGAVPDEPLKPYTQAVAKDAQAAKNAAASATEAARSAGASATQAGLSADNAAKTLKKLEDGIASGDFRGQDGKSAYQLAVDAGFDGTETQWLESLKGAPGDTTAADAAAEAAKNAAREAQKAAEASAGSAAQAAESVGGLADDLATLKIENTALKSEMTRTARSLDYLWKKSKGIIYDTETVTGAGSSVTVPSGAMDYAALKMVGGMSQRNEENNVLIDAPVDAVRVHGRNLIDITKLPDERLTTDSITVLSKDATCGVLRLVFGYIYQQCGIVLDAISGTQYTLSLGWTADNAKSLEMRAYTWADDALASLISSAVDTSGNGVFTFLAPADTAIAVWFRPQGAFSADNSCTVTISGLQLTRSAALMPYAPYRDPVAYPIPQAIRDLCPDYGQGTAESYNHIDFAAKAYHHVGSMSQDGTWTALATPEIIDLSAVWPDDFGVLRVEAGGTINLHYPALDDGFELAVPSETEIMVDVAKVVQTNG